MSRIQKGFHTCPSNTPKITEITKLSHTCVSSRHIPKCVTLLKLRTELKFFSLTSRTLIFGKLFLKIFELSYLLSGNNFWLNFRELGHSISWHTFSQSWYYMSRQIDPIPCYTANKKFQPVLVMLSHGEPSSTTFK